MAQIYTVSKVKQLIDLNGDSVNFEATFQVESEGKKPFYLLVVDQETLDKNPNLEYKHVPQGEISGTVKHDQNVKQNHYLILKADQPCKCAVQIQKKDLPPKAEQKQATQPNMGTSIGTDMATGAATVGLATLNRSPEKNDSFSWIKIILIIAGIVAVGVVIYWFYKSRKKTSTIEPENTDSSENAHALFGSPAHSSVHGSVHGSVHSPVHSPAHSVHSVYSSVHSSAHSPANPMLDRLKNLQMN